MAKSREPGPHMIRDLSRLENKSFDALVIGGGINGAAIAHAAASCGMSVALLEKNDFACGASSQSTKLLHGGLRYLEHLEFDLVAESLRERFIQLKAAPHLARPLPFMIPVYRNDARPLWMMRLGVCLYDFLSGSRRIGPHRALSADEVIRLAPGISRDGLVGGVEYVDGQMDDARLCLENVLMADAYGAAVANYVHAEALIRKDGRAAGVRARDVLEGRTFEVFAPVVIVAAGPWSDVIFSGDRPKGPPRLHLTKGAHLIYEGQVSSRALLLQSHEDGRVFFVIPFRGNTLIGTTDTDYSKDPDDVGVEEEDIQYLLREAARVFPHMNFERARIIASFAGLRPLVAKPGDPSHVSRRHLIKEEEQGVWYVMGGKYTTYRAVAEEAVHQALPHTAGTAARRPPYALYGSGGDGSGAEVLAMRFAVPPGTAAYLQGVYGSRAAAVLEIASRDPALKAPLCSCSPAIGAQVVYARDVEMARSAEDVIARRLGLSYIMCHQGHCRRAVSRIMA